MKVSVSAEAMAVASRRDYGGADIWKELGCRSGFGYIMDWLVDDGLYDGVSYCSRNDVRLPLTYTQKGRGDTAL